MGDVWNALVELDRVLPVWRYIATGGISIAVYRLCLAAWVRLHGRRKPFRCGPFIWKKSSAGDVYAGVTRGDKSYPIWAGGKWVEDDAPKPPED